MASAMPEDTEELKNVRKSITEIEENLKRSGLSEQDRNYMQQTVLKLRDKEVALIEQETAVINAAGAGASGSPGPATKRSRTGSAAPVSEELTAYLQQMQMELHKLMATTTSDADLGERVLKEAEVIGYIDVQDPTAWPLASVTSTQLQETLDKVRQTYKAKGMLQDVADGADITLYDLMGIKPTDSFQEKELQPVLNDIITTMMDVCGSDTFFLDTHAKNMNDVVKAQKPDAIHTTIKTDSPLWSLVVFLWEFKRCPANTSGIHSMLGELLRRCASVLPHQPGRTTAYAGGICIDGIQAMRYDAPPGGKPICKLTPMQPFQLSAKSDGFRLLGCIVATSKPAFGWKDSAQPDISRLPAQDRFKYSNIRLVRPSQPQVDTQQRHKQSYVYLVDADPQGGGTQKQLIVKLNSDDNEVDYLKQLQGLPHVVQLVAHGMIDFSDSTWHVSVLEPYLQLLTHDLEPGMFTQVISDVAQGIEGAYDRGIMWRDPSPRNMGHDNGRGCLFDLASATTVKDGSPGTSNPFKITGTLQWAAYRVLLLRGHNQSSHLEGLFISACSIAMNFADCHVHLSTTEEWAAWRHGQFGKATMLYADKVALPLKPLITALHDLFWPLTSASSICRVYREDVSLGEFQGVCNTFLHQLQQEPLESRQLPQEPQQLEDRFHAAGSAPQPDGVEE